MRKAEERDRRAAANAITDAEYDRQRREAIARDDQFMEWQEYA